MEIILSTIYAILFFLLIRKFAFLKLGETGKYASEILFTLKLAAGVALGLIYTYYYTDRHTADTFRLFDDSEVIFNLLRTDPVSFFKIMTGVRDQDAELGLIYNSMNNWYDVYSPVNDNRFMIRLNTLLRFFSFGHYYVHVVFVSFLSFTGTVALIKFANDFFQISQKLIWIIFGLLPSVLFWGSGLMKDAIVIFSLGMTLYSFGCLIRKKTISNWSLFLFWFIFLLFSRFQIAMVVLPGLASWMICTSYKRANPAFLFIPVCLFFLLISMNPFFNLPEILLAKQQSFSILAIEQEAGSYIGTIHFGPDPVSILINSPEAFITTLLRPNWMDLNNPLMILSTIENIFILLIGAFCLIKAKPEQVLSNPLFWFSISFVLISFTLIGLVTPVLGAMVRYKTPALPFLMLSLVMLMNSTYRQKIEKMIGKVPF